jgi:hypothetical protein
MLLTDSPKLIILAHKKLNIVTGDNFVDLAAADFFSDFLNLYKYFLSLNFQIFLRYGQPLSFRLLKLFLKMSKIKRHFRDLIIQPLVDLLLLNQLLHHQVNPLVHTPSLIFLSADKIIDHRFSLFLEVTAIGPPLVVLDHSVGQ